MPCGVEGRDEEVEGRAEPDEVEGREDLVVGGVGREEVEASGLEVGGGVGGRNEGAISSFSETRLGRTTVFLTTERKPGFLPRERSSRSGAQENEMGVKTWESERSSQLSRLRVQEDEHGSDAPSPP